MKDKLARYFKKDVEIRSQGITYKGYLVGADENYVYLKAPTTWITLPMETVTAIKEQEKKDWDHKKVPGASSVSPEEKEAKRIYSKSDIEKLHSGAHLEAVDDEQEGGEP